MVRVVRGAVAAVSGAGCGRRRSGARGGVGADRRGYGAFFKPPPVGDPPASGAVGRECTRCGDLDLVGARVCVLPAAAVNVSSDANLRKFLSWLDCALVRVTFQVIQCG